MDMLGVGERLRSARVARGLSLDDIEAGTRIRRRYLEALEEEAFDRLPGPTYVRGFLRGYAAYLDLPADEIALMCPVVPTASVTVRASPSDVRITPVTRRSPLRTFAIGASLVLVCGVIVVAYIFLTQVRQFVETREPVQGEAPAGSHAAPQNPVVSRPGTGPAVGSAVPAPGSAPGPGIASSAPGSPSAAGGTPGSGAGGAARRATGGAASTPAASTPPASRQPASPGSAPAAPPVPAAQPATEASPPGTAEASAPANAGQQGAVPQGGAVAGPVTVAAIATDRSWVRAVADGITVFEGFLSAGDQQVWQAKRQLSVRIGNASAVALTVNGRPVGRLGNPGDVVDETYTGTAP